MQHPSQITRLLQRWRADDVDVANALVPLVYDKMRRIAAQQMRGERSGHTLQTTVLVNEALLKLMKAEVDWRDRRHFFLVAARAMRRILIDHARARDRQRRGGAFVRVQLNDQGAIESAPKEVLLDLDRALSELEKHDPRTAEALELHYFAGLTYKEVGATLEVSEATVDRLLRLGKAWMRSFLES